MKVTARPPRSVVPASTVSLILEAFRPYGPHGHTAAEHATYFRVSLRTVKRWHKNGFHMGLYGSPGRHEWHYAACMATAYYGMQRELSVAHSTWVAAQ